MFAARPVHLVYILLLLSYLPFLPGGAAVGVSPSLPLSHVYFAGPVRLDGDFVSSSKRVYISGSNTSEVSLFTLSGGLSCASNPSRFMGIAYLGL